MKKAIIFLITISLIIFSSINAYAADYSEGDRAVTFEFNAGGTVGFNTAQDFENLTMLGTGDRVLLNTGSGITIGVRPDAGMIVTDFFWSPTAPRCRFCPARLP